MITILKNLIKIGNKLDSLGFSKEADKIDLLIKKVASEDFKMEMFNGARKISEDKLESWIDRLESTYGEEDRLFASFDIDIGEDEWTVFYDIRNEENSVAVKGYDRRWSKWDKKVKELKENLEYVCAKVKGHFGDNHTLIGGTYEDCGLRFRVGGQVYSMVAPIGDYDIEIEIFNKKIGGKILHDDIIDIMDPTNIKMEEFGGTDLGGVEWLMYNWEWES
jgi:hypothetical protein